MQNIELQNIEHKISKRQNIEVPKHRNRKISMEQNVENEEYRIAKYPIPKYQICIISNRKISNTRNIDGKNIERNVSKEQDIEVAKYRRDKISKRQNIEVTKYRTQNIEVAKSRTQNIE